MKNSFRNLIVAGLLFASGCLDPVYAQTNVAPPPPTNAVPNFFSTATGFFTSFNPELTNAFDISKRLQIWAGAEQAGDNTTAADVGAEVRIYSFTNESLSIGADAVVKNAGVNGTFLAGQFGASLTYTHIDAQAEVYIDGGYDGVLKEGYCEIGARAKKALTDNTYFGASVSLDIESKFQGRPNFVLFTGFTF